MAPEKRGGFPAVAGTSKAASFPAAPWRSVPQPALLPAFPRVILADHHTYRDLKEVNALKAVADREVIRLLYKRLSSSKGPSTLLHPRQERNEERR